MKIYAINNNKKGTATNFKAISQLYVKKGLFPNSSNSESTSSVQKTLDEAKLNQNLWKGLFNPINEIFVATHPNQDKSGYRKLILATNNTAKRLRRFMSGLSSIKEGLPPREKLLAELEQDGKTKIILNAHLLNERPNATFTINSHEELEGVFGQLT